ncbi:MAG: hypothetical protein IH591_16725 [Bacteroidales bacterium]|nr:hypothetical protein [Bacteroidales bacterium]
MAVMRITTCQQTPKAIPVDIAGEKAAIQKVIDAHFYYKEILYGFFKR